MKTTAQASMPARYARLTRQLHWLMLLLIVCGAACVELRVLFTKGSDPREALKAAHFMLGLAIGLLALLRIGARLAGTTPPIVPAPPAWQRHAALAVHLLLYAWMVVMPLAGWMLLSAEGKPVPFFGLTVPPLIDADKALAAVIKEWHALAGRAGYAVIALHALAALVHHAVWHDDTLLRMLPPRGSTR